MAATRDRRQNAGNKMTRLLEAEDEDEFYTTTYGGFTEEANDNDYHSENSESDNADSDFSIDENDEVKSDGEDDGPKRKKRGVMTKAYKEPRKENEKEKKTEKKKEVPKVEISSVQIYSSASSEKKSLRRSTAEKSKAVELREKEREVRNKFMKDIAAKKNVSEVRRLTQEELLAEAVITEQLNLKSLENYYKLELEKKKSRISKQVYKGPIIRYHSVTMPLIEDITPDLEVNVDEESMETQTTNEVSNISNEKCSRTFITFTDEKVYKSIFPQTKPKPPVKQFCPITRLPANYFDPITQTPYANVQAYKCIRDAYNQQMELQAEKKAEGRRQKSSPVTTLQAAAAVNG